MTVSRRTFIASAAAGSALAAAGVAKLAAGRSAPAPAVARLAAAAASAPGDVVGKITVGYQGWFACIGDGAPIDAWWHWSANEGQPPSPGNNTIKAWPDMSEYTNVFKTAYAPLGSGAPATLFSSFDQQTVSTHFLWMQQNGCDTAALQRFDPNTAEGPTRNAVTALVNTAAQANDRKFYIMYDATGWTNMETEMPADWTANMAKYVSSAAYAHQNGKPVVGIWGFGFNDTAHPWSAAACQSVISFFEGQGCYVMGGVPTYWRTGVNDSRAGYLSVYSSFNMMLKGEIALTKVLPTPPEPTSGSGGTTTITASAYSAENDIQTQATSDTGGGDNVGWIQNGSWLQYNNVNFGSTGLAKFSARVASGAAAGISGLVEVRLDSLSNAAIASFSIASTGGWQDWVTVPASMTSTTGTHTVYIAFVSGQSADFVNLNWFTFS
jgi:hypothetical protein